MLKTFHYEFTGYSHFQKISCVHITLNRTQRGKAMEMISNVVALNQFVRQNNLALDGNPFVLVHEWNQMNDSINFDFCFPIAQTDTVPDHPEIKFKTVEGMISERFPRYSDFAGQTMEQVFGKEALVKASVFEVNTLASGYLKRWGKF